MVVEVHSAANDERSIDKYTATIAWVDETLAIRLQSPMNTDTMTK